MEWILSVRTSLERFQMTLQKIYSLHSQKILKSDRSSMLRSEPLWTRRRICYDFPQYRKLLLIKHCVNWKCCWLFLLLLLFCGDVRMLERRKQIIIKFYGFFNKFIKKGFFAIFFVLCTEPFTDQKKCSTLVRALEQIWNEVDGYRIEWRSKAQAIKSSKIIN